MPHFTTSDGLKLWHEDEGAGLPVLCLSGLTRTTRDFDYVAPHLADCRMIRMDYRGRGKSDWAKDWADYALPVEIRDALELMDHLGVERFAILGTSRGGLNAMGMGLAAPDRLLGVCFNDIGPELDPKGLETIMGYLGRRPAAKTHEEAAAALERVLAGFSGVPKSRWLEEARKHFVVRDGGLDITYDPALRTAVENAGHAPDLWPLFDALAGKPLCLIRGAGSDLTSFDTAQKMKVRRPDMIHAEVPGRGHIPYLDEPEAVAAIRAWIGMLQ